MCRARWELFSGFGLKEGECEDAEAAILSFREEVDQNESEKRQADRLLLVFLEA
jgi:hypothetical protein